MRADEMDELLRSMLDDHRISRAERRALRDLVGQQALDDRTLALFRSRAFTLARESVAESEQHVIEWLENAIKALLPVKDAGASRQAKFSPGLDCLNAIVGAFNRARRRVDVCVFTITDNRIVDALLAAHRRGVSLRIITDDDKAYDRGSDVDRLRAAGVAVRVDDSPHHMHHKFALFDDEMMVTGSYNWTRSAAESNHENLVVTDDAELVHAFKKTFSRLWDQFGRK